MFCTCFPVTNACNVAVHLDNWFALYRFSFFASLKHYETPSSRIASNFLKNLVESVDEGDFRVLDFVT